MKLFAELYSNLDEATKTNQKITALVNYFKQASPKDAVWAVNFLIGRRPKSLVKTKLLREWAAEAAAIPNWLFEESYHVVGDLAETISLVVPENNKTNAQHLHYWVEGIFFSLKDKPENEQKNIILDSWSKLSRQQNFVWMKLMTGGFRVGVSQRLIVKALSQYSHVDENVIAHRLMGDWKPDESFWKELFSHKTSDADLSKPYPFYLAYALDVEFDKLGNIKEWQAEWKWDGIRAQLIKRNGKVFIWSRGEELVTHMFPELEQAAEKLPNGAVLDGEIVVWKNDVIQNFAELQRRLGRKKVGKKTLQEAPVVLIAYDLLEFEEKDIREKILVDRRNILEKILKNVNSPQFILSPIIEKVNSWSELQAIQKSSREKGVEGVMLKKKNSVYKTGRKRGDWWKWKVDPLTIDAVLIYAQRGHGRRANLYTDYTFAVWDKDELVPFAKAYSGLTDKEIRDVDRFVKRNTKERFGPVRTVKPELVFEIAFEGIRESKRHKSGVAVRFPRINRWRTDKKVNEADTLKTVRDLLTKYS